MSWWRHNWWRFLLIFLILWVFRWDSIVYLWKHGPYPRGMPRGIKLQQKETNECTL